MSPKVSAASYPGLAWVLVLVCTLVFPASPLLAADPVCVTGASCLTPSLGQAEALFNKIELNYPSYFSPATKTQLLSGTDPAWYRFYNNGRPPGLATFQGGLWYNLGNGWVRFSSLDEGNRLLCAGTCWGQTLAVGAFKGNLVLGSPTDTLVKINVYAPDQSGEVYVAYGSVPGAYENRTPSGILTAGKPLELTLAGLATNTRYYYRLYYLAGDGNGSGPTEEYTFHTPRPPGSTFTFAIQGDSHPERERSQFDANLYARTLQTAAADHPDFYMTIGDDFSVDTLNPDTITQAQVVERYKIQRPYLGLIGKSAPVFLVNGNHEQAARYLLDGTANNVAVWAQNARNTHYSQPAPDNFYSGNTEEVQFIGKLRNYFAWTWGDALFAVIDPYWGSDVCVDNPFFGGTKRSNLWDITHGDQQYAWLKKTLETSKAKYKFVFAHHVMGTGRGGIELATRYEWGGLNADGRTPGFPTYRPGWTTPIHKLLVDNHVSIFFQGHDHIWVKQQLDGVIYQTLSEPADPNYSLFNSTAFETGTQFPNTGYTRVTVAPTGVKVDYVRTWLPADETTANVSGTTVYSYTVP
ncbi:MAG: metallophosphoesterase [Gammaproteobacteria bacterium]